MLNLFNHLTFPHCPKIITKCHKLENFSLMTVGYSLVLLKRSKISSHFFIMKMASFYKWPKTLFFCKLLKITSIFLLFKNFTSWHDKSLWIRFWLQVVFTNLFFEIIKIILKMMVPKYRDFFSSSKFSFARYRKW